MERAQMRVAFLRRYLSMAAARCAGVSSGGRGAAARAASLAALRGPLRRRRRGGWASCAAAPPPGASSPSAASQGGGIAGAQSNAVATLSKEADARVRRGAWQVSAEAAG
jgi:hypothetical protein